MKATKRLLSVLLALVLTLSLVTPALAATYSNEENPNTIGDVTFHYYSMAGSDLWDGVQGRVGVLHTHYIDGKLGFCIDPGRETLNNDPNYAEATWDSLETEKQTGVIRAMILGAQQKNDPTSAEIAATQYMCWGIITGYLRSNGTDNPNVSAQSPWEAAMNNSSNTALKNAYNALKDAMSEYSATSTTLPSGYTRDMVKVYRTSSIWSGNNRPYQAIAVLEAPQTGALKLVKASANTAITSGNSCYSLSGAVYGVYPTPTDAQNKTNRVGTLTTLADGTSNTITDLEAKTYYVRELTAPKGFAMSDAITPVAVEAGKTATVNVTDLPQSDPVGVLLQKVDSKTGGNPASNALSLEGAEFTVKYYDGQYSTSAAAEASGAATRTWVFKTGAQGEVSLLNPSRYFVSGSDLYRDANDKVTLPLGTIVIQETKAPTGYQLNPEKFVRNITDDGSHAEFVSTYNAPTISEEPTPGSLSLAKTSEDGIKSGFRFQITGPNEYSVIKTTDANGKWELTNLYPGTYTVTELPRDGYQTADPQAVTIGPGEHKTVSFYNNLTPYTLTLKKVTNAANLPLSGFQFKVEGPNGYSKTLTTDANGKIELDKPAPGTYTFTELGLDGTNWIPEGNGTKTVTVVKGQDKTVTFQNTWIVPLHIRKTTPDGSEVDNITFRIKGLDNDVDVTRKTANGGKIDIDLEPGKYQITETVPDGYTNPDNVVTVELKAGDSEKTVTFSNKPILTLKLVKTTDWPSDDPSGFKFRITGPNGYSKTRTTDANGKWELDIPEYGQYTISELREGKALNYQELASKTVTFDAAHKEISVTFANKVKRVEIELIKASEDGKVEGISFRFDGPNGYSKTAQTDADGKIKLTNLMPGTYTATELPTADGRYREATPQTVTINPGETGTYSFNNELVRGGIKLQKADATTGQPVPQGDATLAGTKYAILTLNDYPVVVEGTSYTNGQTVYTLTTDAEGKAETTADLLPFGKYKLVETEAPEGYALTQPAKAEFTITADGQMVDKTLSSDRPADQVLLGGFQFSKLDSELMQGRAQGNGTLEGAVYEIVNRSENSVRVNGTDYAPGEAVLTLTTDANGQAATDAKVLPYGTYELREKAAPVGYLLTQPESATFTIREDGQTVDWTQAGKNPTDDVIRGGVKIQKVDADTMTPEAQGDGTLAGAEYEIYNRSENSVIVNCTEYAPHAVVATIITDENGYAETAADLLPYGKYELVEKTAPEGYLATQPETGSFSITEDGVIVDLTTAPFAEEVIKGRIQIAKHSDTGETGVATPESGAQFRIWLKSAGSYGAAKDTERDIIDIPEDGFGISKDLPYGTYTVEQIKGWDSAPMAKPWDVVINTHDKTYNFIVNNMTFTAYAKVIKVDARTGETIPVAGVGFNVYKPDGEKITFFGIETWYTGEDGIVRIPARLEYGYEYYLMEVPGTEPDGYVLSTEPVYFDVTPENSVEEYNITIIPVEFEDEPTKVQISKQDMSGEELPGAHMRVIEKETGELVEEWISTDEPHMIYNLLIGREYTLIEDLAPLGFVKATSVDFVVADTGEIQSVVMVDKVVTVTKTDVAGNELPGAKMSVIDKETGEVVDEWTSTEEPYAINNLEEGKTYILREDTAPLGYVKISELEFTVTADGVDQHYDVADKVVTVTKTDVAGNELPGAKMSVIDKETGEVVDEWTSTEEPYAINNLEEGKTYILREDTAPLGYVKISELEFTVTADGVDQHYDVADKVLTMAKVDYQGNFVSGAELAVYEGYKLLDKWISADEPHAVSGLEAGHTYILRELSAPEGWLLADPLEFTVDDDMTDQVITMENEEIPELHTTATVDDSHIAPAFGTVTLVDRVFYDKLIPGREYTLTGTPMVKETGKALLDKDGTPYTTTVTFTPDEPTGYVDVTFEIDAAALAGQTVVVFEDLTKNEKTLVVHADIEDEEQSVHFPEIHTTATIDKSHIAQAAETVTLTDVVSYANLIPGHEYTVKGVLMDQTTGKAISDAEGTEITAEATFTPETAAGTVEVAFTFNATELAGCSTVVFEDLYEGDRLLAVHADIEDEDQTVHFPEIRTTLTGEGGIHMAKADKTLKLVDTVSYTNLVPGKQYTVTGVLMDQETGEPILDKKGKEITAKATFTPETADGTVEVTFTFDASELGGKTVVAFEELYEKDRLLAVHADIEDEEQSVHFPEIRTTATVNDSHIALAAEKVTLTDVVAYTNLIPGKEYTVVGTLMDQQTGKVFKTSHGKPITAEATFTAEAANGSVEVTFVFNATLLAGRTTVVFEDLYHEGILISTHADIQDEDQSVHFPEIRTTATVNGKHKADVAEEITLIDVVSYDNLIPGREYTVKGVLMVKEMGKALLDKNGKPVTAEVSFVAEKAKGTVDLTFTFDASELAGKSVVAFEEVYDGELLVGAHTDIEDEGQTVEFPTPPPPTGDGSNVGLWAAMAGLSGSALAAGAWLSIKRRKQEA